MEKMWALNVHMSWNWNEGLVSKRPFEFDDKAWDEVLEEASSAGINTIIFDLLDGISYGSHPEIALEGAWSRERMRKELKKLKSLGMKAIPRLNFSATHSTWLGEYSRMISSKIYYQVCRDLIFEVAELFGHPSYIHLVMDEENIKHFRENGFTVCRGGEYMWHDLQFLFDCVRDTGATPWIAQDLLFGNTEEFVKRVSPEDVLISPWYYHSLLPEHFMPITRRQETIDYYAQDKYKGMNIVYCEDDPSCVRFREKALCGVPYGYRYAPCVSFVNRNEYNFIDMLQYFKNGVPDEQLEGFVVGTFTLMTESKKDYIIKNIHMLRDARKVVY